MRIFIANFGRENHLWPACLARSTVAAFDDADLRPFTLSGDRAGYIAHCIATKKTAAGITPTASVASRWFNLTGIVSSTEDDLWIHRAKNELWWTTSRGGIVDVSLQPAFKPPNPDDQVYEFHKSVDAWSNKDKRATRLFWDALHVKARAFLFTEGTLQQLASDNADYALALIEGEDLGSWHRRSEWKAKEEAARRSPATMLDAKRRTVVRMAKAAADTAAAANGQQVSRTVKVKEFRFDHHYLGENYIAALAESQDWLCAVTGIPLQFDGDYDDRDLVCSLDRIDSDGHYEAGNLQVVCWFVNRWKSDGDDAVFRRLIALVRDTGPT